MADPSEVSVIVPAFNESAAIEGVVSAMRCAAPWREIIVVDDGSADDTSARAAPSWCVIPTTRGMARR